ncbi:hypothetical protein CupriaWKF_22675 [Cupriavidus sp. WKF15]|uniref:hypothetical protein n=1 Tax=Cupriavidus sp. WKF15 TaxID=3032282 RepID=UPI0023E1B3D0|nr:hypothetical protein [Cupriavidus sp. WKF15]WER49916.1 hypothetical protein CupriaWKF_22675 [Cupriavidus sp. WKF15]
MEGKVGRLEKTEAGRQELTGRNGTLDRRSRALLIMVDGQTRSRDLRARGEHLGLDPDTLRQLLQRGFIRLVPERIHETATWQLEEQPSAIPPKLVGQKRSLAAARMYLMDVAERTLGRTGHPIKTRLVEAMDLASIELAFQEFLDIMRRKATPAIVAHIEERFRNVLPLSNESLGRGSSESD